MTGTLTPRQHEVAVLVARGASNSQIGRHLHITENSVKSHVHAALKVYDATDRARLAVKMLAAGDITFSTIPPETAQAWKLSRREIEVLTMVGKHGTNAAAGRALRLSPITVKTHLARIASRMGTGDRLCLLVRAIRAGLIRTEDLT